MPTRCRNCLLDVRLLDMCGGFHSSRLTSTPTLGLFNPRDRVHSGARRSASGCRGIRPVGLHRRASPSALAFAELWAVHRHDGMQPSHPAICDEYLMPKYPVRSPPKAGLNRITRAAGEKEAI